MEVAPRSGFVQPLAQAERQRQAAWATLRSKCAFSEALPWWQAAVGRLTLRSSHTPFAALLRQGTQSSCDNVNIVSTGPNMAKRNPPSWLRPKPQKRQVQIGVTWYTADQWSLVKAASTDADRFDETYEDWVAMAEEATKNMLATGIITERVHVVASELLAWCLAHGKNNDAASRSEFVSHVLSQRSESDA